MMEEPSTSMQKKRPKHLQQSSARSTKWIIYLGFLQWSLQPIRFTPPDIKKQLETLDTAKATDPDNIPAIVLKTCAPELAAPLTKLFHYSSNVGIYPAMWKIVQILKVMEGIINSAIKQHLLSNNELSDAQFGFCKATQLLTSLQPWFKHEQNSGIPEA
eukprot:g22675.t1